MPKTNELVIATCPECGKEREIRHRPDRPLNRPCHACATSSNDPTWRRKLNSKQVSQIKFLREMNVPYSRLSQMFEISPSAIWSIVKGRNWRDVPSLSSTSA